MKQGGTTTDPRSGRRCATQDSAARKDIGEGVAACLDREPLALARRHRDVDVERVGGNPLDGAALPPELAANHSRGGSIIVGYVSVAYGLHRSKARATAYSHWSWSQPMTSPWR